MAKSTIVVPDLRAGALHLAQVEPRFAPVIEKHGLPELTPTLDPFASLGRAIIYQQVAGSAARAIHDRFIALFGKRTFPRPAALVASSVEHLRTAGISRPKALSLLDLAAHFTDGRVTPRALLTGDDEAVKAALLPIRGIGPWSVDMFLLFGLCRPDVWPTGDLGVRMGLRSFLRLRTLPEPARMEKLARPWQPWRSLAAWYMWRVVEDSRKAA
jgi:3-methyladenine DNA glycosylase/8-oxoguanine DNA glycosylase